MLAACGVQGAKPWRVQALQLWLKWKWTRVAEVSALLRVLEVGTAR